MKVSKRTEYGLRAMVAIAERAGTQTPVALPTVALEEGIPEQFLDQIVSQLRKAGFLRSVRGVNGGFMLSRPASEISVGSLMRFLEGSLSPMACVSEDNLSPELLCDRVSTCHTRSVWLRVMEALIAALDNLTLADVLSDKPISLPAI
ncbi:RrF2 family transcriptional regulator [Alicyclobacillus tolerans]|uniref:Rrf2 family protein n=2 Tax=Alicyclobacillus tolerans TaxID=90970 RepID=A0ABT9LTI4_9BACL|nr:MULTISPECIES: Rrf2 family transcriptional regulator [Alicyclobacillus]MDP9727573.1 Rrf2 family protein [Alicyclobacillus tengchongensis]SHJ66233.1 transcriptional regulator, BadM/Rrf2 family [Alicyclobacillus montanus]